MMTPLLALALVLSAFSIAFAVLLTVGHLDNRRFSALRRISTDERGTITFIFDNETLCDATPAARDLLATGPRRGTDWARLSHLLEPRFPQLDAWVSDLTELGEMERVSTDGTSQLRAEWHDGVARISVHSTGDIELGESVDIHAMNAMNRELAVLRAATEQTPFPIWQEGPGGSVEWCNRAYLDLLDAMLEHADDAPQSWPPARIFDLPFSDEGLKDGTAVTRTTLSPEGETRRYWFDVTRHPAKGGQLCTAVPVDDLVKAETSLQEFVTTITKTFATLPIGLAIFNRDRELAMFIPSLLDLTTLPVDFLCAKPSLSAFLDRLRERKMMPEPKDYKSWRSRVEDLVDRARNGTYEENWTLSGGQTYRVTGRPHPDGAIAFLFEDISNEVSHARRYRAEIETSQAALDAMPGAVAMFATSGVMTLSNRAYDEMFAQHDTP